MEDSKSWKLDSLTPLGCPSCGPEAYLHQAEVKVVTVDVSMKEGRFETIVGDGGRVVQHPETEPSGDRQSVVIRFECENCDHDDIALHIYQHEGMTYGSWVSWKPTGSISCSRSWHGREFGVEK